MRPFALLALLSAAVVSALPSSEIVSFDAAIFNADGTLNRTLSGSVEPRDLSLQKRAEVVSCYNQGSTFQRATIVSAIDNFCNNYAIGVHVGSGQTIWARPSYAGGFTLLMSGTAINGCSWTVDGNCNRLLRLPVDQCDTSGENNKHGGYVTDPCGQWRIDPGYAGTDS